MNGQDLLESRAATCSDCGVAGVHVDTSDGEILTPWGDADAPKDAVLLMVGTPAGTHQDDLFCERCAEEVAS